jgi:2'-5' RNA ligase
MTRRVAVDIVLLPPARVSRRAIADSRRLHSDIRLGRSSRPHITLAMANVDAAALPELAAALREAARHVLAFDVSLVGPAAVQSSKHVTTWYHARRSRALMALHRRCLRLLSPYRRPGLRASGFVRRRGERVSASSMRWVRRFAEDAAGVRYRPHITIGRGALPRAARRHESFLARRLALCRLGNHCTCAEVIAEARLATRSTKSRRPA